MKNKKVLMLLAITVVLSTAMTGCSFGGGNDDAQISTVTPTPEPTNTPTPTPTAAPADAQDTTYTSANREISITLPDATWENQTDTDNTISFESPEQGRILILHGSGDEAMSAAVAPSTQDMAVSLERASSLEEGTDFEIQNYQAADAGNGVAVYTYTVHYLNDKSEYDYVVNRYITDNSSEFYSVTGSVLTSDAETLEKVTNSVNSFKIVGDSVLKAGATGTATTDGTTAADGTTTGGTASADGTSTGGTTSTDGSSTGGSTGGTATGGTSTGTNSSDGSSYGSSTGSSSGGSSSGSSSSGTGSSSGGSSSSSTMSDGSSGGYFADGTPVGTDDPNYDTSRTRTIYRNSDGYPLVIYPNGDGTWYDDDGNTYDFVNDEDVYDENGVDYYYHGEPAYVRYMPIS